MHKENQISVGNSIQNALSAARDFAAVQVLVKIVTMAANNMLIRTVAPSIFGIVNIQMELVVSTLLFFAREPIRLASLRASNGNLQSLVNLAWLCPLLGAPIAIFLISIVCHYHKGASKSEDEFRKTLMLFALGGWLDLLAEPFYIASCALLHLRVRFFAEAVAVTLSCLAACVMALTTNLGLPLFGYARIIFGVSNLLVFVVYFAKESCYQSKDEKKPSSIHLYQIIPKKYTPILKNSAPRIFDPTLVRVAFSFLLQSFVKHVLTEGDKIILSIFFSNIDQGIYAIVFNYGSILARIVFLPLEDAGRIVFNQFSNKSDNTGHNPSMQVLRVAVIFHLLIGIFSVFIGSNYVMLFLKTIAGSKWATNSAEQAFSTYCFYIPILGLNGILESYYTAVATPFEIRLQSVWYILTTSIFAISSWFFTGLGASGLIISNCIALLCRIVWCLRFIIKRSGHQFFSKDNNIIIRFLFLFLTKGRCLISIWFVGVWFITNYTRLFFEKEGNLFSLMTHIITGIIFGIISLFLINYKEPKALQSIWNLRKGIVEEEKDSKVKKQ